MRCRILLCASVAACWSCTELEAPLRSPGYEFRWSDASSSTPAGPGERYVFRWPPERMPVRIWVDRRGMLQQHIVNGTIPWLRAFLYDELSAALVGDSTIADIIVLNQAPGGSTTNSVNTAIVGVAVEGVTGCKGLTTNFFNVTNKNIVVEGKEIAPLELIGPWRVFVWGVPGEDQLTVEECSKVVAAHELGHAFGVGTHSNDPRDIMFSSPNRDVSAASRPFLTDRDRATIEVLYHTRTQLLPHRRDE